MFARITKRSLLRIPCLYMVRRTTILGLLTRDEVYRFNSRCRISDVGSVDFGGVDSLVFCLDSPTPAGWSRDTSILYRAHKFDMGFASSFKLLLMVF